MSYAMSQAMSYAMSYVSCDELRPFLRKKREYTKQKAGACRNPSSRHIIIFDEGKKRKVVNTFGLGKAPVSKIILRISTGISYQLRKNYIRLPKTEAAVEDHARKCHER